MEKAIIKKYKMNDETIGGIYDDKQLAVLVDVIGSTEIKDGEICLVGVKCIYVGGRFVPTSPSFKLIQNVFDYAAKDELIIIKRNKTQPL